MRRHYLNRYGKPCLWPIPEDCLWKYGRFETGGAAVIQACREFDGEARLLAAALDNSGLMRASASPQGANIRLIKAEGRPDEAYWLSVDETGVRIEASSAHGMFDGCMTLAQMVCHSFDASVAFVQIEDRPHKPFRGVKIPFPSKEGFPWFLRFADLLSRYKIDRLLLDIGDASGFAESIRKDSGLAEKVGELTALLAERYIEAIPCFRLTARNHDGVKETVALLNAKLAAVDFTRPEAESGGKTAADILADGIRAVYELLKGAGAGLAVSSELLHPSTGSRELRYNAQSGRNDVFPATCGAVDLIPKDVLILDTNHGGSGDDTASERYFASLGFKTVFMGCCGPLKDWERRIADSGVLGACVSLQGSGPEALGAGGNMLAAILRVSCLTWWNGYHTDATAHGVLMPLDMEKEIAGLYPMERDRLNGNAYPSQENPGYSAAEMRGQYNSPLMHSYWRTDDHFMMYLQEAETLRNAIPFSLFQGVLDFRFENAFVMAGGSWNGGVSGIRIGLKARSLAFLHAYVFGKQQTISGFETVQGKAVGRYIIRYADGTQSEAQIVYGRDVCFWKNYYGTNQGAYEANPALMGISEEGLHYTVYTREWVNPKPDVEIASVDVAPSGDMDGRIALFGITAVK